MIKQNINAWFFEGGMVGIPRNFMGLMEPLGLDFDDLGKIIYLLYCGTDQVSNKDRYAVEAARTLHGKGLINWYTDQDTVDFSPMFDKINANLGEQPVYCQQAGYTADELNYAQMIKKLEREQGRFLNLREKQDLETAVQRYNWSYDLVYEVYVFYQKNFRKHTYDFSFFCKMAFGAQVTDKSGFKRFVETLEHTNAKVVEVLRRLGKHNNPSEAQKEMYLKWANSWKFSHEMILLAADENINANNPSFGYVDAVLESWMALGVKTPEALKAHKAEQLRDKQTQQADRTKIKGNKGAVQNFKSAERDLSQLVE